jgi:hypothetical protein
MVLGHYVYATGAWDQRDLYAERHNVWGSVTTYLQAEADRKYAPLLLDPSFPLPIFCLCDGGSESSSREMVPTRIDTCRAARRA